MRDLDIRASLIANTIQEPLQEQLAAGKKAKIPSSSTALPRTSGSMPSATGCSGGTAVASRLLPAELVAPISTLGSARRPLAGERTGPLHVAVKPVASEAAPDGRWCWCTT